MRLRILRTGSVFFFFFHLFLCSQALGQASLRNSFAISQNQQEQILVEWSQVGSGLENGSPFQLNPVLGLGYKLHDKWLIGTHYDFQSLVLEGVYRPQESTESLNFKHSFSLLPELRSFSWKYGLYLHYKLSQGHLGGAVELASLNAWGYGLGAEDLGASAGGRELLLPLKIFYTLEVLPKVDLNLGLESRIALVGDSPKNRFSLVLSVMQGFL